MQYSKALVTMVVTGVERIGTTDKSSALKLTLRAADGSVPYETYLYLPWDAAAAAATRVGQRLTLEVWHEGSTTSESVAQPAKEATVVRESVLGLYDGVATKGVPVVGLTTFEELNGRPMRPGDLFRFDGNNQLRHVGHEDGQRDAAAGRVGAIAPLGETVTERVGKVASRYEDARPSRLDLVPDEEEGRG